MDHQSQHHEHHRKEREHEKKEKAQREREEQAEPRSLHPGWFLLLAVVMVLLATAVWTMLP